MVIKFSGDFRKRYKKLDQKRKDSFHHRLELFTQDPDHPLLKDHALSGKLIGHRAFSVTGDIRVVYYIHEDTAYFTDIGTHNQVYGK